MYVWCMCACLFNEILISVASVLSEGYSSDESVSSESSPALTSSSSSSPSPMVSADPERKQRCLEHLSLVWCSQITDECVVALKVPFSYLIHLLSSSIIIIILLSVCIPSQRIPTLRSLEVSGCGMSAQALDDLRECGIQVALTYIHTYINW